MSLTTAVSDEDEAEGGVGGGVGGPNSTSNAGGPGGESAVNSPYKGKGGGGGGQVGTVSGGSAASFNCTGAVRKAGFLSVKKWLLRKKHQVSSILLKNLVSSCELVNRC